MIEKNLYKVDDAKKLICPQMSSDTGQTDFIRCQANECALWHWHWYNATNQQGYCGMKGELK